MPSVKDFNKTQGNTKNTENVPVEGEASESAKPRRRPGRDEESDIKVVDVQDGVKENVRIEDPPLMAMNDQEVAVEAQTETHNTQEQTASQNQEAAQTLNFKGSDFLKNQFPKPFAVAEAIASDWMKEDAKFDNLPIEQPLVKYFATQGLRKAKEVEKKIWESPVTEKVAMKAFEAGMKAQTKVQEVKSSVDLVTAVAKSQVETLKKKITK